MFVCAGASWAAAQSQAPETTPLRRPASPQAPPATATFLGGVPAGTATPEPFTLTIVDAIRRALEHNLGVLTAEQDIGRAAGARWRALGDLLPNAGVRITETRQTLNLQ